MSFVAAAIAGGAVVGGAASIYGASKSAKAAGQAADATTRSTELQIQAGKDATRRAIREAKIGNEAATNALVTAAQKAGGAERKAAVRAGDAKLKGLGQAANSLLENANAGTGAKLKGVNDAQTAATSANLKNNAFFKKVFATGAKELEPWRDAGKSAIASISAGLADGSFSMDGWNFEADPGYQFRLEQGQKALDRSAAARGNLLSGGQLAASTAYNSGMASQEYASAYERARAEKEAGFNRLIGVADRGQQAVNDTAVLRDTAAARVGAGNLNIADAKATGALGRAGALSDFFDTRGRVQAGYASDRGNVLADRFGTIGGIDAGRAREVGTAIAQGKLNIANAAATGATNLGNVIANARANEGAGLASAAIAKGQAGADMASGVAQSAQSGIGNWLMYDLLKGV